MKCRRPALLVARIGGIRIVFLETTTRAHGVERAYMPRNSAEATRSVTSRGIGNYQIDPPVLARSRRPEQLQLQYLGLGSGSGGEYGCVLYRPGMKSGFAGGHVTA
ncbi:hypothetical protein VE04_07113, partial [Pseudogymnoascus sp. 24MN13]